MEDLDIKEIFNIFWNRKIYMILIVIIFVLMGIVYTFTMVTPRYSSFTTLIVAKETSSENSGGDSITQTDITLNQKLLPTYSQLIKQKTVLRPVVENLKIPVTESQLESSISIKLIENSEIIKITVTNENPEYAAVIANEVAKVFTEKVAEIYSLNNVSILDKAETSKTPYNIKHTKDIAMFTLVGLVVAAIYAIVANMLDTTIKTQEDIEKRTKLIVLAEIPLYESDIAVRKGGKK